MPRLTEGEPMPAITGTGTAVGSQIKSNFDIAEFSNLQERSTTVDRLGRKVGIEARHWVDTGEPVSELASQALLVAMEASGITKNDVDSLYLATSTPDRQAVNTAATLQEKLDLRNNIFGSVNMDACPGWISAVYKAVNELSGRFGTNHKVAVIGAEVTSLFMDPNPEKISTTILFGDAAGATIWENVTPDQGAPLVMGFAFGLDGKYADNLGIIGSGSDNPTNDVLKNGLHSLHMDGKIVFDQATRRIPQVTTEALQNACIPQEEVDWFIFHQANLKIIQAAADALNIPFEKCIITIQDMGNTSSASIPTALDRGIRDGRIQRNHIIATGSFGGGLFYAGAVFPMVGLQSNK